VLETKINHQSFKKAQWRLPCSLLTSPAKILSHPALTDIVSTLHAKLIGQQVLSRLQHLTAGVYSFKR
jgi:hypothetical protein